MTEDSNLSADDRYDESEPLPEAFEEEQFELVEPGVEEHSAEDDFDPDSEEKARLAASAADAVRAGDIVILDLRELTIIADFFLVCTGKSSIQIRAIADRIEERMREEGYRKLRVEGYQEATWILLDYGDVVMHVMAEEQRAFYGLEQFWESAPRLEVDFVREPTTLSHSMLPS